MVKKDESKKSKSLLWVFYRTDTVISSEASYQRHKSQSYSENILSRQFLRSTL